LTLYLDSSALVKRYVAEQGSDEIIAAMEGTERWVSCWLGYVETARAVGLKVGAEASKRVKSEWATVDVVEMDAALAERAAEIAVAARLRTLDALHLAAALAVPGSGVVLATWDRRLHAAARAEGLETLPAALD
jgi:uncharacterized protein